MSTTIGANNNDYHLIEDGASPPIAEARPVPVHVTVVRQVQRKKRTCGVSCCCCLIILMVLLLALFLPRSPAIRYEKFAIEQGSENPFVVEIKFKSRQPVEYSWKNLELKLQYKYQDEVFEAAKFSRDSKFSTGAYASKKLSPSLNKIYPTSVAQITTQCFSPDGVLVRLKGHVHNYENTKFPVQTNWNLVYCSP